MLVAPVARSATYCATHVNVRSLDDYRPSPAREISAEDVDRMLDALDAIEESSKDLLVPPPDVSPWMVEP